MAGRDERNAGALIGTFLALAMGAPSGAAEDSSVLGYLEPYRSIEMSASEEGVIGEIHAAEGQSVEEGEALLSLDNRVLEAQLEIAKVKAASTASVKVAEADLEVAAERYEKLSQLKRSGTAHSSEVARAEADKKKAEGQLSIAKEEKKIAEFRVEEIQAQIERRILRSPIDGVVLEINGEVAESARPASRGDRERPLVKVARIDRLELVVHVPAAHAGELKEGRRMPVRVLRQGSLTGDRDDSAIDTEGIIEFVSPAIDPSSETVRTRLVVDNEDGRLRSGSHALVLFQGAEQG